MSDSGSTSKTTEIMTLDPSGGLADNGVKAPALFLRQAGASDRFFDFFTSNIRNKHTRRAYYNAACRFSEFCAERGAHDLTQVKPIHVAGDRFVESEHSQKDGRYRLGGRSQEFSHCRDGFGTVLARTKPVLHDLSRLDIGEAKPSRHFADSGRRVEISQAARGGHARFKRSAVDFRQRGVQDRKVTGQFLFLPLGTGGDDIDADLVRFDLYILTLRAP
jgi:hypothetical protein